MKRTLFGEIAFPALLLGVMWLAFSAATSAHLHWLEGNYAKVVGEHVTTLNATGQLQVALWDSYGLAIADPTGIKPDDEKWQSRKQRMKDALKRIDDSADLSEERQILSDLQLGVQSYEQALESFLRGPGKPEQGLTSQEQELLVLRAVAVSQGCEKLRELNSKLIDQLAETRRIRSNQVSWLRSVLMIAGPVLGAWLGLKIARRTQNRVAQLSLKLRDVSFDLGRLQLEPARDGDGLSDVDQALQVIAGRIKQVIAELDESRRDTLRKERLAAVGQLTAGVAHELRNPLTAVKLLVQTTAQKASAIGFNTKQLEVVQDEIARMERTIQALLDFARPAPPHRTRHDLRETLQKALNLVQGRSIQEGVELCLEIPDEPTMVDADAEQLHQVFVNLLLNSLDATSRGGHVQITLVPSESKEGLSHKAAWLITISDTGSGIPPNLLERIFDPFVTSKERGTGLGLAVSRGIVDEHGGRLVADNSPEHGAIFTIELPSPFVPQETPLRLAAKEAAL